MNKFAYLTTLCTHAANAMQVGSPHSLQFDLSSKGTSKKQSTHPACPFARFLRCDNRHIAHYAPAITP